jgi:hypothetical protein
MAVSMQATLLESLATMLRPIVKLLLLMGVGYSEFNAVAKSVFIEVATAEYGLRGRPANMSRVAAMTGISRKEISKYLKGGDGARWTPSMESSPINSILHFWRHDSSFTSANGEPRALPFEGPSGFTELVAKYGGDIPAGAMKKALLRSGSVTEDSEGRLFPQEAYRFPTSVSDDFFHGLGFSLANLGGTLLHNTRLRVDPVMTRAQLLREGRFERSAWSEYLSDEAAERFRAWVETRFWHALREADDWNGQNELPQQEWASTERRTIGVGVYFFRET